MELKIYKEEFVDGIIKASNIIPYKTGAAFLRTIWFKGEADYLKIMSTDSNVEFIGQYKSEIKENGLMGTQGKKITELIRKMRAGPIVIKSDTEKQSVLVKQDKRKYKLPMSENSWFPELEEFPEKNIVSWSGEKIRDIVEKNYFCISDDDTMQAMTCLKIAPGENEKVEVCAFNGHQLSYYTLINHDLYSNMPRSGILIPKKYLAELRRWLPSGGVDLCLTDSRIFFRTQDQKESLSLPLSMYQFPDYHQFIMTYQDKFGSHMTINRNELMESLERIQIFNTEIQMSTVMELSSQELRLSSTAVESGEAREAIGCSYKGDLDQVVFNTKNVLEIMEHFDEENITFSFAGQVLPCKIHGENNTDYFVMTMPVQIEQDTYYTEEEII